jgi:hypothetical protein
MKFAMTGQDKSGLKVGFLFWWSAGHQLQKFGGQAQILMTNLKKIGSQR